MKKLEKSFSIRLAGLVLVVISLSACSGQQGLLDKFAASKENYGFMLQGYAYYQGDTVSFDLISAVSFPICKRSAISAKENSDRIVIKTKDGRHYEFYRYMVNFNAVPDPTGDGKAMTAWRGVDEQSFAVFKKVVANGTVAYGWNDLQSCFEGAGFSKEQAKKMSEIAQKPLGKPRVKHS